jgi:hypothetical protein
MTCSIARQDRDSDTSKFQIESLSVVRRASGSLACVATFNTDWPSAAVRNQLSRTLTALGPSPTKIVDNTQWTDCRLFEVETTKLASTMMISAMLAMSGSESPMVPGGSHTMNRYTPDAYRKVKILLRCLQYHAIIHIST